MKRFNAIILALLLISLICGCAQNNNQPISQNTNQDNTQKAALEDDRLSVVCTVFPQYDWVRQILGERIENVNLELILDSGADLHSFQPTVDDIIKISNCDLFIYIGGESDEWVEDVLAESSNPNMIVINLLDALGSAAKIEELVEGMEEEEEEEGPAYDEHVWLSLKNAQILCTSIADALSELDSEGAEAYKNNLASYIEKLSDLDTQYEAAVQDTSIKTLLFGDRFPFRYLLDDYGLTCYAAFPGCSAETEASFETIVFLADKADELNIDTVMVTESSDQSIAKTIIENTSDKNQQIAVIDSMQSVTSENIENGATYLSIMESNLNVLKEIIN